MKINKILFFATAGLIAASCADLDTEPAGGTITADQKAEVVANNPARTEASVNGITANFTQYDCLGDERHNDFGYPAQMLFLDTRGIDLVGFDIGYNWFTAGFDFTDRPLTSAANLIIWTTLYNQIYTANAVAKLVNPETEDPTLKFYLAQALAIRAFDYFNLAQLYQFTYEGNDDAPCVPLVIGSLNPEEDNTDAVASEGNPRATVGQVYAQIDKDINLAIELLEGSDFRRADRRYVDLATAYGIRARINLVKNDWAGALRDAKAAIAASDATPISIAEASVPRFNDMSEKDWMWGVKVTDTDRVSTTGICNWPSHMGSLNYGYASVGAWRRINTSLYDMIQPTDARKGWFLDGNGVSANLDEAQQDYVTNTAECPAYTQVKFAPYQGKIYDSTNASDIPLMRIEEMYLIQAEAEAMTGNPSQGASTLQSFIQTYRDPEYKASATSAEDVQDQVWIQRRIELWGEGLSYFDLMRLRKGIDRASTNWANMSDDVKAYNYRIIDTKAEERAAIAAVQKGAGNSTGTVINYLIFQIPNAEVQANSQINEGDNNLGCPIIEPVN